MRRAFVSHSTADDSFIAEMESFLRAAGFDDVFNDVHAIQPDEKFWPRIEQGITDCDAFVVVLTAASTNSEWVKREAELARRLGKRVIPVWREDCPLPAEFTDRDVIDFRPRTRKERRFDIGRIVKYAPAELIGREDETRLLSDAWQKTLRLEKGRPHVLTFVALGGEGKTSLVAKWAAELAWQDWPGCDAAFAWSFYSQGTREQLAASSDLFLKEALAFFGDEAMAGSAVGAYEKGRRLAQLVGERRALLILDGLEPLQYAPSSPTAGELKDQGLAALLKGLAAASHGLCVVTTRYSLPDLKTFWQTTAPEVKLLRLSRDAGMRLLKTLAVTGTPQEFATLVEDVKGHALTLTLLGGFLKRAFHGDIRQRDRVKFEKADEKMDGGHAFRTMAAYEQWLLRDGGDEGRREVAVLRLMGLFDRPADAGCLAALRTETISSLTEPLAGMADDDWEYCLTGLETANLLTVSRDASGALVSLDAHPLLREYFARQLRTHQPDAWRTAHRRLYEHLCKTTTDKKPQPTLEDLQPLYQAVMHGCSAGLFRRVAEEVLRPRIHEAGVCRDAFGWHTGGVYSTLNLGAHQSDLGAYSHFFDVPWTAVKNAVPLNHKPVILNCTAISLRANGELGQACKALEAAYEIRKKRKLWQFAAINARNIGEVQLLMGNIAGAIGTLRLARESHDRSTCSCQNCMSNRMYCALVLGQAMMLRDNFGAAQKLFVEAKEYLSLSLSLSRGVAVVNPFFAGTPGYPYMEFLLAVGRLDEAAIEAQNALTLALSGGGTLLDLGLSRLTLGRIAAKRQAKSTDLSLQEAERFANEALSDLKRSGFQEFIADALLNRAALRVRVGSQVMNGHLSDPRADLDEAWEIAERGPMRLHMADIHLYRARLFFREKAYPWESPAADLAAAEKLINDCGYHRRDEELADAKRAILGT